MKIGYICPSGKKVSFSQCPCKNPCLPAPVMRALKQAASEEVDKECWRVSEIIGQPTQVILRNKFDYYALPSAEVVMLWGTMIHVLLEKYADGEIAEERKKATFKKWCITGKPDIYIPSQKKLIDYKFTNSFTLKELQKENHPYCLQLNLYRYLFYPEAEQLELVLFMRDASGVGGIRPVESVPVSIMTKKDITSFLTHALENLEVLNLMPVSDLPPCPERWNNKRCLYYCDVKDFCPYIAKQLQGEK